MKCHEFAHKYLGAWLIVLAPWVLWLEQPAKSDPSFDLPEMAERRRVWQEGDVFNE